MDKKDVEKLREISKKLTEVIGRLTVLSVSSENIGEAHSIIINVSNDIDDIVYKYED